MNNKTPLIVTISSINDIKKITNDTKYINLNISTINNTIINYFKINGKNYLYSDFVDNSYGYTYVSYNEFLKAENIIDDIYDNMPNNLNYLEIFRYLYINIAKYVSFDINSDYSKNETYNLSLVSNINNLWGSLSIGRITNKTIAKIYYYICKRKALSIKIIANDNEILNEITLNNQILYVNLFKDLPYISANMQTKYFANYNNYPELDKKIKYIKYNYNDYYLDASLKDIDYTKEDFIWHFLSKTQTIIDILNIPPVELSIIYNYLFKKYCPTYEIKINNLYLNNPNKNHFIMISYHNYHYSYNYKKKTFVKVKDNDIIDNISIGKIGLYSHEYIPNINNI